MAKGSACHGARTKFPCINLFSPVTEARSEMIYNILSNPNTTVENKIYRLSLLKPLQPKRRQPESQETRQVRDSRSTKLERKEDGIE